ncbi:hypothetical protein OG230_27165 [Streptomyces sp. NBC_00234]|uniref:hypothetical protein n=1 Tax=Streptomyces sp. NBC_00234 TaxID=2903638 RepID=UPI002E2CB036|nr:hypothetical protein [Streptomyces sp. NBC_00234]
MPELTALDRPGPSEPAGVPLLFDVYVSDECTAVVNGEHVDVGEGESVHEAILDRLQRHARDHRGPVRATVFDRGAHTLRIEVAPDGSSRIPDPDENENGNGNGNGNEIGIGNERERERETEHAGAAVTVDACEKARPEPAPEPAPDPVAERVERIREAVDGGDTEHAGALAAALRECLAGDHGAGHPQALEARAMEAYVAHLAGDHRLATSLAMGVARIRCGLGDARAADDVMRATAAWQWLPDERAVAAHGRELLHLWAHLEAKVRLEPPHAEAMRLVRQHFVGQDPDDRADLGGMSAVSQNTCAL